MENGIPLRAVALPSPENWAVLLQESLAKAIRCHSAVHKAGSSLPSFVTCRPQYASCSRPHASQLLLLQSCAECFLISPIPYSLAQFSTEEQPWELWSPVSGKMWSLTHQPSSAHPIFSTAAQQAQLHLCWSAILPRRQLQHAGCRAGGPVHCTALCPPVAWGHSLSSNPRLITSMHQAWVRTQIKLIIYVVFICSNSCTFFMHVNLLLLHWLCSTTL